MWDGDDHFIHYRAFSKVQDWKQKLFSQFFYILNRL